jgi:adenosylcobyric acid synthase
MTGRVIMIQGTASHVGKSVLVTALCRIFKQDGFKVAPFKAQNMALNSFVTKEGGEIGRAQAVQAEAAGIEPSVHINPVLLKPEAEAKSQVIVLGKVAKNLKASQYYKYTPYLLGVIEDSLNHLRSRYDIVVVEGAGSPAEVNLKEREIVNMRIARMVNAPVLLVGDIDRGGVFASIIGTLELLAEEERDLVKGLIINKFRGDMALLKPGLDFSEKRTGKPFLGVIPYFRGISIAQEDSVYLDERTNRPGGQGVNIAVIRLPHISNYDDFDPLEETGCTLCYTTKPSELSGAELIILPGTKSTIADLLYLRQQGLDQTIIQQAGAGTPVIGICGGYQMLGKTINDPHKVESKENSVAVKTTTQVKARIVAERGLFEGLKNMEVTGYEIHMGQTRSQNHPAVFQVVETPQGKASYSDGATSDGGLIFGTYIHGFFHNANLTHALLNRLQQLRGLPASPPVAINNRDRQYDELSEVVGQNLNMREVYKIALGRGSI